MDYREQKKSLSDCMTLQTKLYNTLWISKEIFVTLSFLQFISPRNRVVGLPSLNFSLQKKLQLFGGEIIFQLNILVLPNREIENIRWSQNTEHFYINVS